MATVASRTTWWARKTERRRLMRIRNRCSDDIQETDGKIRVEILQIITYSGEIKKDHLNLNEEVG
jgi:hypothetical protein